MENRSLTLSRDLYLDADKQIVEGDNPKKLTLVGRAGSEFTSLQAHQLEVPFATVEAATKAAPATKARDRAPKTK